LFELQVLLFVFTNLLRAFSNPINRVGSFKYYDIDENIADNGNRIPHAQKHGTSKVTTYGAGLGCQCVLGHDNGGRF
jgi:hypothetical protein